LVLTGGEKPPWLLAAESMVGSLMYPTCPTLLDAALASGRFPLPMSAFIQVVVADEVSLSSP
jgi:hypothetical protein